MNRRIRKKHLRVAERAMADACRLYMTRPRGTIEDPKWEEIARGMLQISLAFTLDQWAQHGPSRLRQNAVWDVSIDTVDEAPGQVRVAGALRWTRRQNGIDTEFNERFLLDCPVPSLAKTPKTVQPRLVILVGESEASETSKRPVSRSPAV